jgi:hypothetical protein
MSSASIRTATGRRRLSRLALGLAALTVAATAPTVSAEEGNTDCARSLVGCVERTEVPTLIPGSADVIATFVPLKDSKKARALYEKMLPDGFVMPAEPRFWLQAAQYFAGTNAPIVQDVPGTVEGNGGAGYGTRWMEQALCMRVARELKDGGTEEGWFMVAIGTDGNIAYGGIDLGYPKYRAHTYLDRSDGANVPSYWTAGADVVGRGDVPHADPSTRTTTLRLEWREDRTRALPADADPARTAVGYYQFPVHKGPETTRGVGRFLTAAEAQWIADGGAPEAAVIPGVTGVDKRPGLVNYVLEPDLLRYDDQSEKPLPSLLEGTGATLDDLMVTQGAAPGYAFELKQGFLLAQGEVIVNSDGTEN